MTNQPIVSPMLSIVLLMEVLEQWGIWAETRALGNVVELEPGEAFADMVDFQLWDQPSARDHPGECHLGCGSMFQLSDIFIDTALLRVLESDYLSWSKHPMKL